MIFQLHYQSNKIFSLNTPFIDPACKSYFLYQTAKNKFIHSINFVLIAESFTIIIKFIDQTLPYIFSIAM